MKVTCFNRNCNKKYVNNGKKTTLYYMVLSHVVSLLIWTKNENQN